MERGEGGRGELLLVMEVYVTVAGVSLTACVPKADLGGANQAIPNDSDPRRFSRPQNRPCAIGSDPVVRISSSPARRRPLLQTAASVHGRDAAVYRRDAEYTEQCMV